MRTRGIDAAPAILQQRAGDVLRGVCKGCERQDLFRMRRETPHDVRVFPGGEMAANVVGEKEDLMREDIDPQRAAKGATFPTGQREVFPPDDLAVQRIDSGERGLRGAVEFVR